MTITAERFSNFCIAAERDNSVKEEERTQLFWLLMENTSLTASSTSCVKRLNAGYWTVLNKGIVHLDAGSGTDNALGFLIPASTVRFFKNGYQGIQHRNLLRDSQPPQPTNDLPF